MTGYETAAWPFVKAKWFGVKRTNAVRLIVIHDMEFPERMDSAEVIAHDFATRSENEKASSHICVDADTTVQCVKDSFVAFAAPGANHDGIQIELAGFGAQKTSDWRDNYSNAMLGIAADDAAQYCLKYNLPILRLTDDQLYKGGRGFVGHDQVSRVYKQSDHTDPGPDFPWMRFIMWTRAAYEERRAELR
jgi:N-acetyl-anhydromuramyl-L-alanine amidase AmpD